jgi:pimeloyl-ACP methyl ester carboxylesterase
MARMRTSQVQHGVAEGIGYLRRRGSTNSTLVLLHGIGSNAGSFAPLLTGLPETIDAIAWDAPGYGQSKPLDISLPSPRDYAAVLAKFLDALDISSTTLAGHSLGALFAGSFARHYPDRVSALALMPGAALPDGVQSRIDEIRDLGPEAFAKKRAARLVGDPAARPEIIAAVAQAMGAVNPAGYVQAVYALGAGQLLADAAAVSVPSIVAVGTLDQITPPKNARSTYAALANAVGYHEVPGAGHALPQEEPEAVANILAEIIVSPAHV